MNSIVEYFEQSELALAAYANLTPGVDPIPALQDNSFGMTSLQAAAFASKWTVLDQYTPTEQVPVYDNFGVIVDYVEQYTGLSATVFEEVATGKRYLAIRGTEITDLGDLTADGGVLLHGIPDLSGQYQSLHAKVAEWQTNGVLPGTFTVAGHSLGGWLAEGLAVDFAARIEHTYVYNSPGLFGAGFGDLLQQINNALGTAFLSVPSLANLTNIRASAGLSLIAGLGQPLSPPIGIVTEDQTQSDVPNPAGSRNHSQRVLTDSLAVYTLFAELSSSLTVENIGTILNASGNRNAMTLEDAINALGDLFQAGTSIVVADDRDALYTRIQAIRDSAGYQLAVQARDVITIQPLANVGSSTITAQAQLDTSDGLAYRYTLVNLLPFAITGDASLYASHNVTGAFDLYDPATSQGTLTAQYLKDRAKMLSWKMQYDTGAEDADDDLLGILSRNDKPYTEDWDSWTINGDWDFIDHAAIVGGSPLKLTIDGVDLSTTANHQIVFGSSNADSLAGGALNDNLYGGGGNDTLTGGGGNDYLEGGLGYDTYVINAGDGFDTLVDVDGSGVVRIAGIDAKGSAAAGLAATDWLHAAGSATWLDQSNGIIYSTTLVDGETRLLIKKGDAGVLVRGWSDGDLGIVLGAGSGLPSGATKTYTGGASTDWMQNWDGAGWGWDGSRDYAIPGSLNRYQGLGGSDFFNTDLINDVIEAGDGNDYVLALYGGADELYGGDGNDYLYIGDPDPANDGGASSLRRIPTDNRTIADGGDGNDTITVARRYMPMAIALDGTFAGLAYSLGAVAGSDLVNIWSAAYAGWQRASATFYILPGTPAYTFTGWERDGVSLVQSVDGRLNLYATFRMFVPEFSALFDISGAGPGQLTRFTPALMYNASDDNDDKTGHTLFGGAGNDMIEGGLGDDVIDGGADNDALDGEGGADTLFGGAGDDLILGGEGNDWLIGGTGSDELYGETGNDTYIFSKGDGIDWINDHDTTVGNVDVVQFLDVASYDVTALNRYGNDLTISYGVSDQLTVAGYFNAADRIEQLRFSDGETWGLGDVNVRVVNNIAGTSGNDTLYGGHGSDRLDGGAGNDSLYGDSGSNPYPALGSNDILLGGDGNDWLQGDDRYTAGNDMLDGGAGNDTLIGGEGSDVYLFGRGDGQDEIREHIWLPTHQTPNEFDVLRFKPGVANSDVVVTTTGPNLVFSIIGTTDRITVWHDLQRSDFISVEQIQFDDGTTWDMTNVMASLFAGTPGADTIFGTVADDTINGQAGDDIIMAGDGDDILLGGDGNDFLDGWAGNDILDGGPGNDRITSDAGSDTYFFGRGDGQDYITTSNYYGGIPHTLADGELNILQFKAGVLPSDVWVSGGVPQGLSLKIVGTEDQVDVHGFFTANSPVQQVWFTDGTVWSASDLAAKYFAGTPGDDILDGTVNSDTISGQAGRDTISGGEGNDVIDGGAGDDRLYGDAGNDVIRGGAGDDTLFGSEGDDIIEGGAGNDFIYTSAVHDSAGNDTYLFGKGDGQDTIDADNSGIGIDRLNTLQFKPDVSSNEVNVTREADPSDGDLLVISIAGTTDKITVHGFFRNNDPANPSNPLQQIRFDDGSTWDLATIMSRLSGNRVPELSQALPDQTATEGAAFSYTVAADAFVDPDAGDTLTFSATLADGSPLPAWLSFDATTRTFSGTPSTPSPVSVRVTAKDAGNLTASDVFDIVVDVQNLTLNGTANADTLTGGSGNDVLNGHGGNDTLVGNAGNDVLDGGTGGDTMQGGAGDDIYVVDDAGDDAIENAGQGIDTVRASIDYTLGANIENLTLTGVSALNGTGNALDNALRGNGANNTLTGGLGNDTYLFGSGFGQDVVDSYDPTAGKLDIVQFDGTIAPEDVIASRSGNDLILSIDGTSDVLTIRNYLENDGITPYSVEQIRFHDGTVWDLDTVKAVLNVASVNHAPELSQALPDQTATESEAFSYTIASDAFVDSDVGDALSYSATLSDGSALPAWLSFDAVTRTFSGTPATAGTYSVTVTAEDSGSLSASDVFDIVVGSVAPVNHAPEVSQALLDQSATEGAAFSYTVAAGAFTDPDSGDSLTYTATLADGSSLPAWLSFDAVTRTFSGIPSGPGAISMRVTAEDTGELTASDVFELVVASTTYTTINGTSGSNTLNGTAGNDIINGLAGNDTIHGNGGNDIINGGPGNDTLNGGEGNDQFLVEGDSGIDTVNGGNGFDEIRGSAGDDIIRLSTYGGVNTVERIDGGGGYNRIAAGSYFASLDFSTTDLVNIALIEGNAGDNQITGSQRNDVITGGAGNDVLNGGAGNDLFLVEGDSGSDTVSGGSGFDEIRGSSGDDIIRLSNYVGVNSVERIDGGAGYNRIAVGSFFGNLDFSTTDLMNIARIDGSAGDNQIIGSQGDDVIAGGAGNDTLNGEAGDDLFLVEGDSGSDTVSGGDGFDQIVGSVGDDIIRLATYGGANTVERIDGGAGYNRIAAGSYFAALDFSTTELVNIARIEGGGGDNQITGSQGDDVISGGAGADTLRGGAGNDAYLLGRGYGKDTVIEQDATAGNTDTAQFLSGVTADQIWFRHLGNDLEASIIGTADKLVIKDWYLGTDRHVEQFQTTDGGLTLLDSQVESLVAAMASFAPPSAGQTTLPQTYQDALAGVIAANWQ